MSSNVGQKHCTKYDLALGNRQSREVADSQAGLVALDRRLIAYYALADEHNDCIALRVSGVRYGESSVICRYFEEAKFELALDSVLLNKLLDGFDGKLTSSKWATMAKCSTDTALRDITELLERGGQMRYARSTNASVLMPRHWNA
jgi:hypothetical protein